MLRYAFTEMVNNVIDHSGASEVHTRLGVTPAGLVFFEVVDRGVGALENVRRTFGLTDHLEAMQQLSKGKLSTQPERHSGEGLFFTSKAADHFELLANGLRWVVDKARADQALGQAPPGPGTQIRFELQPDTRERLEDLFARYTHDFEFDTTRAVIKLFAFRHQLRLPLRGEAADPGPGPVSPRHPGFPGRHAGWPGLRRRDFPCLVPRPPADRTESGKHDPTRRIHGGTRPGRRGAGRSIPK